MSSPISPRRVEAIAACARALAGSSHADAGLERAGAPTIGVLRAIADRMALADRHHDAAIHRTHAPSDPHERALYDALALARLDAIGCRWLAGMRSNLLAHPGAADDGPRWLGFEVFSGHEPPAVKAPLAARTRALLRASLVDALRELGDHLDDPAMFAPAAAAWAKAARPALPEALQTSSSADSVLPMRTVERRRRAPRPAADAGSSRRNRADPEQGGEPAGAGAAPAALASPHARADSYRVYTTAFDRVVNAAALATREELQQLHDSLESELGALRTVVARLAKRLLRVLMSQQVRHWRFDVEEGLLDGARLSTFVASGGRARPFKQESESPFPDTVVTLLIDHSGSMRGRPMQIAALTVEIFARVLERCGVRCEVLGFTTRDWNGGEPARQWEADGYPEAPGRLNAIEHIVIKDASVPWRRARIGLGLSVRDEMLKENIDGEAVTWAHTRLLARPEPRRILVVVSDGTPMDEATFAANGYDYLDDHLVRVVEDIETRSPVQLAAIGIGHDVSRFYRNATRIARIDDLGPALTAKLLALLEESQAGRRRGRRRPRPG